MTGPVIAPRHATATPRGNNEISMDPAVTMGFSVSIEPNFQLGVFTSVDGLSFEVTLEQRESGGNNAFVHQLPTRVKYQNVKLKRPINRDSQKIIDWFHTLVREMNQGKVTRKTMTISALNVAGDRIATWTLQGVIPVKWQGPSFTVDSGKVAEETLEFAHHGFLDL